VRGDDRFSKGHSLLSNAIAEPTGQCALGNDINFDPEQVAQIHQQAALVQQGSSGLKSNHEIDIRSFICVASRLRTEDPDIKRSVLPGDAENGVATVENGVVRNHAISFYPISWRTIV